MSELATNEWVRAFSRSKKNGCHATYWTIICFLLFFFSLLSYRSNDKVRAVARRECIDMERYSDALRFHADNTGPGRPSKRVEEWKADPCVLSVTEEGLPPGWVKIVRQCPKGRSVFFKSPTRTRIRWVPRSKSFLNFEALDYRYEIYLVNLTRQFILWQFGAPFLSLSVQFTFGWSWKHANSGAEVKYFLMSLHYSLIGDIVI
jgi:hypothetical protein